MITGTNGRRKSKPVSAMDRLRNVHIAIMADDTDLVCDAIVTVLLPPLVGHL